MKATGLMTKQMDSVCILIWMEQDMKANGRKINNMGKDRSLGQMEHFMMGIISMGRNMGKALSNGLTMQHTRETSMIITSMALEHTSGQMGENTLEIGRIIRCMEEGSSSGQTVEGMKGVMWMTRRKVKGYLNGLMEGSTLAVG